MLLLRNYVLRSEYVLPPPSHLRGSSQPPHSLRSSREQSRAIILIALPVQFSPSVQDFCTTQISVVWESVQFIKRKQNKVGEPSTLMDTVIRESSNSNHKLLLFFLLLFFFYQTKTTTCLTNTKLMHFKNAERFAKISFFHSYIKECLPRWKILLQLGHR